MHSIWKNISGAAMVEMTAVTPFLIILGLGMFEFGNYFYNHHIITTGIRDAARYLAHFKDPLAASAQGQQLAVTGEIVGGQQRIAWWNAGDVSINLRTIANPLDTNTRERRYRGKDPISIVQVSTNVNYGGLGFLNVLGLGATMNIALSHEERVIGGRDPCAAC